MLFNDKKKAVTVILSKLHRDGRETESDVAHESGEHNEYTACAEDMLAAFKSGSVQDLAACLKAFHEMIEEEHKEQGSEG